MEPVDRNELEQHPTRAARALLGTVLAGHGGTSAVVVETEAYHQDEAASHSFRGVTQRCAPMFGRAGTAYVYVSYGIHRCVNVVTGPIGEGAAVLVRAAVPLTGIDVMQRRRMSRRHSSEGPIDVHRLCDGPGKLAQALGFDSADNGADLVAGFPGPCSIASEPSVLERLGLTGAQVLTGPRIGISVATELHWRYGLDCRWLSRPFPADRPHAVDSVR